MNDLKVTVVSYGRKNLRLAYVCPETGKRKSVTAGTADRRKAERAAAKLEQELRDGVYRSPSRVAWQEFRDRYEAHLSETASDSTLYRFWCVANRFEELVGVQKMSAINKASIERFVASLKAEDKATATVQSYLRQLLVSLNWAKRQRMIAHVPTVDAPVEKRNGKRIKATKAGGRAITGEEFDRLIAVLPRVVGEAHAASWAFLLRGLWFSGLRIGEAALLTWDDDGKPSVDFSGGRPMLWFPAEHCKAGADTRCPMAPEFAALLESVDPLDRTGYVFNPTLPGIIDQRPRLATLKRKISDIGKMAGVKVKDREGGTVKHASAHDLRRAFGFRWSTRVMPAVLKDLMRHADISTTMSFYVTANEQATADAVWTAFANTLPTLADSEAETADVESTQVVSQ